MALSKQKKAFAEAIIAAKPERISNKQAALLIGCNESSASATGSRCAADAEVKAFILAHWPLYYHPELEAEEALATAGAEQAVTQQNALPLFCARDVAEWLVTADKESVALIAEAVDARNGRRPPSEAEMKAWVEGLEHGSEELNNLVFAVTRKMRTSTDPMAHWDRILIDPFATDKQKEVAAAEKAKYTKAKPVAQSKKDSALSEAMVARFGVKPAGKDGGASLLGAAGLDNVEEQLEHRYGIGKKVPQWPN